MYAYVWLRHITLTGTSFGKIVPDSAMNEIRLPRRTDGGGHMTSVFRETKQIEVDKKEEYWNTFLKEYDLFDDPAAMEKLREYLSLKVI